MMLLLLQRTKKKTKTLMPFVTEFVTKLTQPMFQGIDVVRYTKMSRASRLQKSTESGCSKRGMEMTLMKSPVV